MDFDDSNDGTNRRDGIENNLDVVELTGPLTMEQKAHHLATFMGEAEEEYNREY